eukprot:TRINITY_DN92246_c0_g1_i1.p1 TRINITY_DN92246_c0_g1~~TRINITY_DN92246_c0_g1_i1.p1  ORF type:complete len:1024 (+),score=100.42 TRINITY_DN92246_c0_g1_i1:279-3350(+)
MACHVNPIGVPASKGPGLRPGDWAVYIGRRCTALRDGGLLVPGSTGEVVSTFPTEAAFPRVVSLRMLDTAEPLLVWSDVLMKRGVEITVNFKTGDCVISCTKVGAANIGDVGIVLRPDIWHGRSAMVVQFPDKRSPQLLLPEEVNRLGEVVRDGFYIGDWVIVTSSCPCTPIRGHSGTVVASGRDARKVVVWYPDCEELLEVPAEFLRKANAACVDSGVSLEDRVQQILDPCLDVTATMPPHLHVGHCTSPQHSSLSAWPSHITLRDLMKARCASHGGRAMFFVVLSRWRPAIAMDGAKWVDITLQQHVQPLLKDTTHCRRLPSTECQGPSAHVPAQTPQLVPEGLFDALLPAPDIRCRVGQREEKRDVKCRTVVLTGFSNPMFNRRYVERQGEVSEVAGRETYWSEDCVGFLFWSSIERRWFLACGDVSWFPVKLWNDNSTPLAYGPIGGNIRDPSLLTGWTETTSAGPRHLPNAGVKALGKVSLTERVVTRSLLSTFPGAEALLRSLLQSEARQSSAMMPSWHMTLCKMLRDSPSDGGELAILLAGYKMQNKLTPEEAVFLDLCQAAASARQHVEKGGRSAADQKSAEAASRAATALEAEEAMLEKRRLRRQQQKKRKKTRDAKPPMHRGRSRSSSGPGSDAERDVNVVDIVASSLDTGLSSQRDLSEQVAWLRELFPMFDDNTLLSHFLQADDSSDGAESFEAAIASLSARLDRPTLAVESVGDVGVKSDVERPQKSIAPSRVIIGYVVALTDHPKQPLYCFIVMVVRSSSLKYREGKLVRPVPQTCVERDDEMGRFWVKKSGVPAVGSRVKLEFVEEDTLEYLAAGQGQYPQQNEDLLCSSLTLQRHGSLWSDAGAQLSLTSLTCRDVTTKWPWGSGLQKFASVTPGKFIWYVPAWRNNLPSVVLLRISRESQVEFVYRNAASNKISCHFGAGGKRLTDIPVTAAGYCESPQKLNSRHASREHINEIFVLGLARAERRGPQGHNRWVECSDNLKRMLNEHDFEEYCQILLIGVIDLGQL